MGHVEEPNTFTVAGCPGGARGHALVVRRVNAFGSYPRGYAQPPVPSDPATKPHARAGRSGHRATRWVGCRRQSPRLSAVPYEQAQDVAPQDLLVDGVFFDVLVVMEVGGGYAAQPWAGPDQRADPGDEVSSMTSNIGQVGGDASIVEPASGILS